MGPLDRLGWLSSVAANGNLPASAPRVAIALAQYANSKTGISRPGIDTIASETGLHRATVVRCLDALKRAGHVTKKRGGGRGQATEWHLETVAETVAVDATETPGETVAESAETVAETVAFRPLNCRTPAPPTRGTGLTLEQGGSAQADRGRRWGQGEEVPPEWIEWAEKEEGLTRERARRQAARFTDYWNGVPGKRGVKVDWQATWRNWIRRDEDDRRRNGAAQHETPHERIQRVNGGPHAEAERNAPGTTVEGVATPVGEAGRNLRRG